MKKVVLVGDSIRMGYQKTVETSLAAHAPVRAPKQNSYDSGTVLEHLEDFVYVAKPDIVHINCGLHDVKRDKASGVIRTSPEKYRSNVEAILGSIGEKSGAEIIWAMTTPVDEEKHNSCKEFDRFNRDILAFNEIARGICEGLGIEINDLHAVVQKMGIDSIMGDDGVHFTDEGYEFLGRHVASIISPHL